MFADFEPALDEDLAWELFRLRLVFETGWTFEYIDELTLEQLGAINGYWQGAAAAREKKK